MNVYTTLYVVTPPETDKCPAQQRYKAKIVRLHAERNARILLDTTAHDSMEDEETSLYHFLKMLRRRETRTIQQAQDSQAHNITKPKEVRSAIVTHCHCNRNIILYM